MSSTPHRLLAATLTGAAVLAGSAAASAAAGPTVEVRAVSTKKQVIAPTIVGASQAFVDSAGVAHVLTGPTALGATVTAANVWGLTIGGSWFDQYGAAFVTRIAGVTAPATGVWSLYINDRFSAVGATDVKLKKGQKVTWLETANYKISPKVLDLVLKKATKSSLTFSVWTVGGPKPVAAKGAVVHAGRQALKVNRKGIAVVPNTASTRSAFATLKGAVKSQTLSSLPK